MNKYLGFKMLRGFQFAVVVFSANITTASEVVGLTKYHIKTYFYNYYAKNK